MCSTPTRCVAPSGARCTHQSLPTRQRVAGQSGSRNDEGFCKLLAVRFCPQIPSKIIAGMCECLLVGTQSSNNRQGYVPDQTVEIKGFATLPRVESDWRPMELSHPSGGVFWGAPLRRFSAKFEYRTEYVDRPSGPFDRM